MAARFADWWRAFELVAGPDVHAEARRRHERALRLGPARARVDRRPEHAGVVERVLVPADLDAAVVQTDAHAAQEARRPRPDVDEIVPIPVQMNVYPRMRDMGERGKHI